MLTFESVTFSKGEDLETLYFEVLSLNNFESVDFEKS
jgi:hypothetical protein